MRKVLDVLGAEQVAGSEPTDSVEVDLEAIDLLLALIEDELEFVGRHLVRRSYFYAGKIEKFDFDPTLSELTCRVQGSTHSPNIVTIHLPTDDEFMGYHCTCSFRGDGIHCQHTAAALMALGDFLRTPGHPLRGIFSPVPQTEVWKSILPVLDRFVNSKNTLASSSPAPPENRIVWRISTDTKSGIQVRAFEQKRNERSGSWTTGKKRPWDRLLYGDMSALSDADRLVIAKACQHEGRFRFYGEPDVVELLRALKGHPNVEWENGPKHLVNIDDGTLGLVLEDTKDGYVLGATVDGIPLNEYIVFGSRSAATMILADKARHRVLLLSETGSGRELLQALHRDPLKLPRDAQSNLLQRLPGLESVVPVALPQSMQGVVVPPDNRVHLLCAPTHDDALRIDVRVQPVAGGTYFPPGVGPETISGWGPDGRVQANRDFALETSASQSVAATIGIKVDREWSATTAGPDETLDLLAALRDAASNNVVVAFQEGSIPTIAAPIQASALRIVITDKKDWFGVSGTIDVDGVQIPFTELLAGLQSGRRYVRVGPNRWALIEQALRDRLLALGDAVHQTRKGMEIDWTAAPLLSDLIQSHAITAKQTRAWTQLTKRLADAESLDPEPPDTLVADLRDYQRAGYKWLRRLAHWGVGACLADDMGLGKTVQALAVLIDRWDEGPTLVIAPTSVGFNWARETQRFAPTLRPILYRDTDRDDVLGSLGAGDVVIISYGLLLRDQEKLGKVTWGTLVLDEAQMIKNSQTKTAQAVRVIDAKWRLAMTGTPIENHLGELWSLFRAISPGLLGSWERFRERFADPIERLKDNKKRQALSRLVRPFILRRAKSEVLAELPVRTEIQRTAELSKGERKVYEDARLAALMQLASNKGTEKSAGRKGGNDQRFVILAALTRLRQLACHPKLVDAVWKESSAKLDLFLELIDELREGEHRALVFSQFTQHLALIGSALQERGISYLYLDGQTPPKARAEKVDAFQRGEADLFLISLKAGGTGLNLTAADYVIHMDPWWNPAVEDQATDRAHRIGQTRPVTVYRLVAKDTIEEQILALHADKRTLVADILDGTDQAGKLSSEDLIQLIRDGGRSDARESPNGEWLGSNSKGNGVVKRTRRTAKSS